MTLKFIQLSELFEQAVLIADPAERLTFIEAACDSETQREELRRLVQAHATECQLVDNPQAIVNVAKELNRDIRSPQEGETIGLYRLLEQIGEGGMGHVFMAEQTEPIRRRVAIKVIKPEVGSQQVLARFDAEREALTRLDHPNVTRILDAGVTEQGLPYFVMELVRGDSLIEFCDRNKLSIKQRIELLEKVCLAVNHAHQKGILHRDIKPSNVMVTLHDGSPVPKVIDFGIAKALDRPLTTGTLFTRYGDMVGTPQYMSPEQAEKSGLDLDVRTDIYSLGVLLYELLTSTTPIEQSALEGKGMLGILETVRDCDTESPSLRVTRTLSTNEGLAGHRNTNEQLLKKLIRGELDWITLKALSKDRTMRYESAAAMAQDLRRYLNGDSVEAAAPTFLYLGKKLFRKHRTICLAMASCAVLLVAVSIVSIGWAMTNARLRQLDNENAAMLAEKSNRLEKLNEELTITRDRARLAEKQALTMANQKKKQAAEERAMNRFMLSMFRRGTKTSDQFPLNIAIETSNSNKVDAETVMGMFGGLFNGTDQPEITLPPIRNDSTTNNKPPRTTSGVTVQVLSAADVATLRSTGSRTTTNMGVAEFFPNPAHQDSIYALMVEEYKKEFGTDHEIVVLCLLKQCESLLEREDRDWAEIEAGCREALAILNKLPQDTDDRLFLTHCSNGLLARSLAGQNRTFESEQLFAQTAAAVKTDKAEFTAIQKKKLHDILAVKKHNQEKKKE